MTIVNGEFEQSDLEKDINDSQSTLYQNAIHYKENENAFIKSLQVRNIFSSLCYKTRRKYD